MVNEKRVEEKESGERGMRDERKGVGKRKDK